jgi:hypothetical protein
MKTLFLLLTTALLTTAVPSRRPTAPVTRTLYAGQSCVYFCRETGAVGYAYGGTNTCQAAYNFCRQYGGKFPQQVFSHYGSGYGSVALGTNASGGRVIGTAAGYPSQAEANQRARQECAARGGANASVHDEWYVP